MMRVLGRCLFLSILAVTFLLPTGCTYMKQRGNDAMDIIDIGVTVTPHAKPQFALFFDFFNLFPIGYSKLDGKWLGMSNRQAGWIDFKERSWGGLVWGSEMKSAGEFNPLDPHQTRADQRDATEPPTFDTGVARIPCSDNPPPTAQYFECDRVLHLGWIGVRATLRPGDLLDFVLGWTTLDIMHDDNIDNDGE